MVLASRGRPGRRLPFFHGCRSSRSETRCRTHPGATVRGPIIQLLNARVDLVQRAGRRSSQSSARAHRTDRSLEWRRPDHGGDGVQRIVQNAKLRPELAVCARRVGRLKTCLQNHGVGRAAGDSLPAILPILRPGAHLRALQMPRNLTGVGLECGLDVRPGGWPASTRLVASTSASVSSTAVRNLIAQPHQRVRATAESADWPAPTSITRLSNCVCSGPRPAR